MQLEKVEGARLSRPQFARLRFASRSRRRSGWTAFFVTAADDPADAHPATFDIVFNVKAKCVEAFGGSGPVSRRPDGSCVVPIASCQGVLIVLGQ